MTIDVVMTPPALTCRDLKGRSVVVIDVLRASTTIVTAIHNGADQVFPMATVEEVFRRSRQWDGKNLLLCGERKGIKVEGFDLGNSPDEYSREVVRNKIIFFTSSNGSRVLTEVQEADAVMVAGFVNITAVKNRVIHENKDCVIACAGREGQFSLEDTVCAGMLVQGLQERLKENTPDLNDDARAALILYRYYSKDLLSMVRESIHGRYLASIHMDGDLKLCASVNGYDMVPVLTEQRLNENSSRGFGHGET